MDGQDSSSLGRSRLILLAAALVIVSAVMLRHISVGEFNYNVDETVHACTGLYVADFLRSLPITHPVRFTFLYYTHYPSLGLIHWPPLFYLAEGIAFLFAGPSVIAARVVVLCFALIGCYYWFRLVETLENPYQAAISTVVFAVIPFVLLYEKTVMLEIPSLAFCIAASYYWIRFLRSSLNRDLWWFTATVVMALLSKQTSIYLLLFCILTVVVERKWNLLANRSIWKSVAWCLVTAAPFYVIALRVHWSVVQSDVLHSESPSNPLTFYFRMLPYQLGVVLLCLSIAGLATSRWWGRWENTRIMLVWIASCYLTMTAFAVKFPRYIIYWIPPFIYFAVGPLASARLPRLARVAGFSATGVLLVYTIATGWEYERPYVKGYAQVAEEVAQRSNSGFLLFDGDLPGNFIFFLHGHDPGRRFVVLRKALYAVREFRGRGSMEFVKNQAELEKLMSLYGIRIVIVDNSKTEFESQELLRDYLHSPRFKLIAKIPIETNMAEMQGREFSVYENEEPTVCQAEAVHTEMMQLPFNIEIQPAELGIECNLSAVPSP